MSNTMTSKFLPASSLEKVQNDEVLLKENNNRWVMFPIEYDSFWVMYKEVENNFWAAEDFMFSEDSKLLARVPGALLESLNKVLSYHLMLDNTLVCRPADMTLDLLSEVQVAEARAFYGFQLTDENVHSETVGAMFQHLGGKLDKASGAEKVAWLARELRDCQCFFKRALLVVVSKLVFSCSLAVLRDFLARSKTLPTYTSAMDAMNSDRHIHVRFAFCAFQLLVHKMVESEVAALVRESVRLEFEFCAATLPLELMNLKEGDLKAYVEFSANNVLLVSGYKPLFKPDFEVDWLRRPRVDLNVEKQVPKTVTHNEVETMNDIKFDEDF